MKFYKIQTTDDETLFINASHIYAISKNEDDEIEIYMYDDIITTVDFTTIDQAMEYLDITTNRGEHHD